MKAIRVSPDNYERLKDFGSYPGSCYAGLADIEKYGWAPQGKPWESGEV